MCEQNSFFLWKINIFDEESWKVVALVGEDDVKPAEVVGRPHAVAVHHLKVFYVVLSSGRHRKLHL